MKPTPIILNEMQATAEWLAAEQKQIIVQNMGKRKDAARLVLGLRLGLAAWILAEATNTQLLQIVNDYKTSPNN